MKVSIWIILYKAKKYIPYFLASLLNQNYKWTIEILLRDNEKEKSASKLIKKILNDNKLKSNIDIKFFAWENIWHSWWHNNLIEKSTWEIYICASNDMYYPKDFISKLIQNIQKSEKEVFTIKSMYWDFNKIKKWNIWPSLTSIIDSVWIWITKKHYFYNIWQFHRDKWQFDSINKLFWASWSLIIFKKTAIEKLLTKSWYVFDEKYVPQYKNDVELWYRLNAFGISIKLLPNVKAYHHRQVSWNNNFLTKIKNHLNLNPSVINQSIIGHLTILNKYLFNHNFWIKLRTYVFELLKFIFILLFNTKSINAYIKFLKINKNIKKIKIENKTKFEKFFN